MELTRPIRIYADTSVFGGCFDEGFEAASRAVFELVRGGSFSLVVSDITLLELDGAPVDIQNILATLPGRSVERVFMSEEIETLRNA